MQQVSIITNASRPGMSCIFESGGYFLPLSCIMDGLFANPPDRSVVAAVGLDDYLNGATVWAQWRDESV